MHISNWMLNFVQWAAHTAHLALHAVQLTLNTANRLSPSCGISVGFTVATLHCRNSTVYPPGYCKSIHTTPGNSSKRSWPPPSWQMVQKQWGACRLSWGYWLLPEHFTLLLMCKQGSFIELWTFLPNKCDFGLLEMKRLQLYPVGNVKRKLIFPIVSSFTTVI